MAKFKVYYTIELNEIATQIFESNDFGRDLLLCRYHLFLDSFKSLGRCSVFWQLHMRPATAQADDLKLVRLGDFR